MTAPVYLNASALLTIAGSNHADVLAQLCSSQSLLHPLDFAAAHQGAQVTLPDLKVLKLKKRDERTMDRQAMMGYATARQLDQNAIHAPLHCGLYGGLPTISALVPGEEVLSTLSDYPRERYPEAFLQHTQPMSGLFLLNSSLMSHVSRLLQLQGEMAAFSHFSDAGAQALIEAIWSLKEGRNQQALVLCASNPVTPFMLNQLQQACPSQSLPVGEGAAALLLGTTPTAETNIQIIAMARGFVPATRDSTSGRQRVIEQAITQAGLNAADICMAFSGDAFQHESSADYQTYQQSLQQYCPNASQLDLNHKLGWLGPATLPIQLQLSATLLQHNLQLDPVAADQFSTGPAQGETVLINCAGFYGQFCSILIRKERHNA